MNTNNYITVPALTSTSDWSGAITYSDSGSGGWITSLDASVGKGISPRLYFKYIKKKFGTLERMKLESRIKRLEKAFNKAVDNGQLSLGEKLMNQLTREVRESGIYAKGIKFFIESEDLKKHKRNIRGGHISDTKFEDFTRVIPDKVLKKKKKVEAVFDGFVIFHYWNEEAHNKEDMTPQEREDMRDPVLFGVIKESQRFYFIADWDDDYCDLSFEEMIDVIGKDDEEHTISRNPVI